MDEMGDFLCSLLQEYQKLKVESRKCVDKAMAEWWEAKAVEAEKLHDAAVRFSCGGYLLKLEIL